MHDLEFIGLREHLPVLRSVVFDRTRKKNVCFHYGRSTFWDNLLYYLLFGLSVVSRKET